MKNTHLEHIEDEILNRGTAGARSVISMMSNLKSKLSGRGSTMTITVKYDGAPAVVCGTDPDTGMFFVGTKSVFNKTNPKVCYTHSDIDFYYSGQLAEKLHTCLTHFPKLKIKGILQGDLLFTDDVECRDGSLYFTANTLTYSIGAHTEIGRKISQSSVGIVFHTTYEGTSIANSKSVFGADISTLEDCQDVFVTHAYHDDPFGFCMLDSDTSNTISKLLSLSQVQLSKCGNVLNVISKNQYQLLEICKPFFNQFIRDNRKMPSAHDTIHEFLYFYSNYFNKKIHSVKQSSTKDKYNQMKNEGLSYIARNSSSIYLLIAAYKGIQEAKNLMVKSLGSVKTFNTYIKRGPHQYASIPPEGFVAIQDGHAVKLVNRLEFSYANFSVEKNWSK